MEIAILINDRAVRTELRSCLGNGNIGIKEYSTAADAVREFFSRRFDLIIMDWKVYPGYGCTDVEIRELATLIPNSRDNENLLYWQVALRVIDNIRQEESQNAVTPILFRFPLIPESYSFGQGDELTKETITTDLKVKSNIETVYGVKVDELARLAAARVSGK